jgi:peptidyl-prolyl cis-trans isomerase SurA
MRTQNSEVRIQNEGARPSFWILDSGFWILFQAFCILLFAFPAVLFPEIIDRIVITAGNQVITQSQVEEEIRVTAFLNREKVDLSADAREQAAGRLTEQALIKREMDLSRYPLPELSDTGESLESLKAMYPSETDFQEALQSYGITADELTRRLWWQLTLLRFIDYRFRPGIQIPATDVQAYYRQQVSEWEQKGTKPIPTIEDSRDQIEEILTQKRIDQALEQWIKDTRSQVTINYLDPALRPAAAP